MLSRRRSSERRPWILIGLAGLLVGGAVGCSTSAYRKDADSEVYRIIEEKQEEALGHPLDFTIDRPEETARDRIQALLQHHRLETLGQKLIREIETATPEEGEESAEAEDTGDAGEPDEAEDTGEAEDAGEQEAGADQAAEGEAGETGEAPPAGREGPYGARVRRQAKEEAPQEGEAGETGAARPEGLPTQ